MVSDERKSKCIVGDSLCQILIYPTSSIIDADGHVRDRDAELRKFIAEPYCRRQGSLLPADVWDSSMYGKLGMRVDDVPTRLARHGYRTDRYLGAVSDQ